MTPLAPTSPLSADSETTAPPRQELTRRAGLNAVAATVDYGAKAAVDLWITPILVHGLGHAAFGIWQILLRLMSYMAAADGRPTHALKWVVASEQHSPDVERKRHYLGSALGVWLLFLPLLLVVGGSLAWAAPHMARVPAEYYGSVRLTAVLMVVNFLLAGFAALPEAVLRGMNLGYKRMGLVAGLSVVGGGVTVLAVRAGWGLPGLATAQVVVTALTGMLFFSVGKKFVPWFGIVRPVFRDLRGFMGLSAWFFFWTLTNKLLLSLDVLLLGAFTSSTLVTGYVLNSRVPQLMLGFLSLLVGAVTPGLGGVIGSRQLEKATQLRWEMENVSWLMSSAVGAALLICNPSFLTLWVGRDVPGGVWLNLLVVVVMAQLIHIRNQTYLIDLTLQVREKVLLGLGSVLLTAGLCVYLIPKYGMEGLCVALLVGRLPLGFAYPRLLDQALGPRYSTGRWQRLRLLVVMAALYGLAAYFGERWMAPNWTVLLMVGGFSLMLSLFVSFLLGLSAPARMQILHRVQLLRRRLAR